MRTHKAVTRPHGSWSRRSRVRVPSLTLPRKPAPLAGFRSRRAPLFYVLAGRLGGSIPNTVPKTPTAEGPHTALGLLFRPRSGGSAVADLLTAIRRDIDRRLDELRPVRDEFRRLEQARDALATSDDTGRPARARRAKAGSTRSRMTRAQSQEIDRQVLALLIRESTQRPAGLAMLTETSVGSMNARLNRLVRDGKLKKRKRGRTVRYDVQPADG
jgi:hypothetical protein